jgi:hypothetical protein
MSVILASWNELGSIPSLSVSWKSLREFVSVLLKRSDRIQQRIHQVLDFSFFGRLIIAASISFHVINLFRWLISSWFNFGWSCI